ncbi:MAG: hypothetical protein ABW110_13045 [Steroidobacteraceae bacterium]
MPMSQKELGIAQVLLQRLNELELPYALNMKERVDRGELLTAFDHMFLKQSAEERRCIPALVQKQPQFKPLADRVSALYEYITAKARENASARR